MSNNYTNSNGVLDNKLGITEANKLRKVEYSITSVKENKIVTDNMFLSDKYSLNTLKNIHEYLFEDVYGWAGKFRTVPYAKHIPKTRMTAVFVDPEYIEKYWNAFEKQVVDFINDNEKLSQYELINKLANLFAKANFIHPFPEGNGRTLKIIMHRIGEDVGMNVDFSKIPSKDEWDKACGLACMHGEVIDILGGQYMEEHPLNARPIFEMFTHICEPIDPLRFAHDKNSDNNKTPDTEAKNKQKMTDKIKRIFGFGPR